MTWVREPQSFYEEILFQHEDTFFLDKTATSPKLVANYTDSWVSTTRPRLAVVKGDDSDTADFVCELAQNYRMRAGKQLGQFTIGYGAIESARIQAPTTTSAALMIGLKTGGTGDLLQFTNDDGSVINSKMTYENHFVLAGMLKLGGETSGEAAVAASGDSVWLRLADNSDFADLRCRNILESQNITTSGTIRAGTSNRILWSGRSAMRSPEDGDIRFLNEAEDGFGALQFFTYSKISSPSDGNLLLTNAAEDDFDMLLFGGQTSNEVGLLRSGKELWVRYGDNSGFANLWARGLYTARSMHIGANYNLIWTGRSYLSSTINGDVRFSNSAGTGFRSIQLGPSRTTDATPSDSGILACNAWAEASTYQAGADLNLAAGIGSRSITIVDYGHRFSQQCRQRADRGHGVDCSYIQRRYRHVARLGHRWIDRSERILDRSRGLHHSGKLGLHSRPRGQRCHRPDTDTGLGWSSLRPLRAHHWAAPREWP